MLANTLFPVIMLPKIHICGDRRTPRVAVWREASYGWVSSDWSNGTSKTLCVSINNIQGITLFILTVGIRRRFPLAKLSFSFPEKQGPGEFCSVIRGCSRPCLLQRGFSQCGSGCCHCGSLRAECASFSSPDSGVPDGNSNRKLDPGAEKQAPVQQHWLLHVGLDG